MDAYDTVSVAAACDLPHLGYAGAEGANGYSAVAAIPAGMPRTLPHEVSQYPSTPPSDRLPAAGAEVTPPEVVEASPLPDRQVLASLASHPLESAPSESEYSVVSEAPPSDRPRSGWGLGSALGAVGATVSAAYAAVAPAQTREEQEQVTAAPPVPDQDPASAREEESIQGDEESIQGSRSAVQPEEGPAAAGDFTYRTGIQDGDESFHGDEAEMPLAAVRRDSVQTSAAPALEPPERLGGSVVRAASREEDPPLGGDRAPRDNEAAPLSQDGAWSGNAAVTSHSQTNGAEATEGDTEPSAAAGLSGSALVSGAATGLALSPKEPKTAGKHDMLLPFEREGDPFAKHSPAIPALEQVRWADLRGGCDATACQLPGQEDPWVPCRWRLGRRNACKRKYCMQMCGVHRRSSRVFVSVSYEERHRRADN